MAGVFFVAFTNGFFALFFVTGAAARTTFAGFAFAADFEGTGFFFACTALGAGFLTAVDFFAAGFTGFLATVFDAGAGRTFFDDDFGGFGLEAFALPIFNFETVLALPGFLALAIAMSRPQFHPENQRNLKEWRNIPMAQTEC